MTASSVSSKQWMLECVDRSLQDENRSTLQSTFFVCAITFNIFNLLLSTFRIARCPLFFATFFYSFDSKSKWLLHRLEKKMQFFYIDSRDCHLVMSMQTLRIVILLPSAENYMTSNYSQLQNILFIELR